MKKAREISDYHNGVGSGHLDQSVGKDWSKATRGEVAAEVLRVFPGSYITGSRLVDPAECRDVQKP